MTLDELIYTLSSIRDSKGGDLPVLDYKFDYSGNFWYEEAKVEVVDIKVAEPKNPSKTEIIKAIKIF